VTDRSFNRGTPTKSAGLHVYSGTACASALAAMSASYTRVAGSRSRLAPRRAQVRRYAAKCSDAVSVERKYVKVRLRLLTMLLTGAALAIVARDVRTRGQLGQRYRATDSSGSSVGSDIWPRRITVEVSSIPRF
jgi:hypothetical protein